MIKPLNLFRFIKLLTLLCVGWVIVLFIVKVPFWALMDDYQNIVIAKKIINGYVGFWDAVKSDFGNGTFRPLYILYIVFFYGLFG